VSTETSTDVSLPVTCATMALCFGEGIILDDDGIAGSLWLHAHRDTFVYKPRELDRLVLMWSKWVDWTIQRELPTISIFQLDSTLVVRGLAGRRSCND
jgi:hypothetical protein